MPRIGRKRKKTRTHIVEDDTPQSALSSKDSAMKIPKSVVVRRGKVDSEVSELLGDVRRLMLPHTALKLNENLTGHLKLNDYAKQLTTSMGVTHILSFSQNTTSNILNLRIGRTPAGPTLAFKVKSFSLGAHVRKSQRRPVDTKLAYSHSPIVVTNNFGDASASPHVKLMRITFQNMFPSINVATVKLTECKRVVLFHLLKKDVNENDENENDDENDNESTKKDRYEDDEVEVRHYAIRATPVGVDRKVRRLIQCKLPNLSKLDDVSDYIMGNAGGSASSVASGTVSDASDSEDEGAHVVLPQNYRGRGNMKKQKSALKLIELGPRMRLKLIRVERGLGGGDVMYHAYQIKTEQEARETKQRVDERDATKKRRRLQQEENVDRKKREKDEKKEIKQRRREEREREMMDKLRAGGGSVTGEEVDTSDDDDDDEENSVEEDDNSEADDMQNSQDESESESG